VTVAWTDPATAAPAMLRVVEAKQNGATTYQKPEQGETVLPKSPRRSPPRPSRPATNYAIQIVSGARGVPRGRLSVEMAMGTTVVIVK